MFFPSSSSKANLSTPQKVPSTLESAHPTISSTPHFHPSTTHLPASSHFFQGEKLPLLIAYQPQKRSHLRVHEQALQASLCYDLSTHQQKQQIKSLLEKLYRQTTLKLVQDTLKLLKPYQPKPINKITIKKIRSRWGSCSANGNLNFNLDLAKLPPEVQQYVVIHEFSHLFQMNHSAKFWDIVAKFDPNYKLHRRTMRLFEKHLHLQKEAL